jgi:hypothetical protein
MSAKKLQVMAGFTCRDVIQEARDLGVDVVDSLITISQHPLNGGFVLRINYGPKDYTGRRGGDLLIEVDVKDASIRKVLRGQ